MYDVTYVMSSLYCYCSLVSLFVSGFRGKVSNKLQSTWVDWICFEDNGGYSCENRGLFANFKMRLTSW